MSPPSAAKQPMRRRSLRLRQPGSTGCWPSRGRPRPWAEAATEREECYFPLRQGQAYALSGDARNVCLHGVLAEEGSEARESLNLRFGLHERERESEFSAWREVERFWEKKGA